VALYVKILPIEWGSNPCLRLGLFGCAYEVTTTPAPTTKPTTPEKCKEFECDNGKKNILNQSSGGIPSGLSRLKPTGASLHEARDFQIMHFLLKLLFFLSLVKQ
jgi:hypothetical protein